MLQKMPLLKDLKKENMTVYDIRHLFYHCYIIQVIRLQHFQMCFSS